VYCTIRVLRQSTMAGATMPSPARLYGRHARQNCSGCVRSQQVPACASGSRWASRRTVSLLLTCCFAARCAAACADAPGSLSVRCGCAPTRAPQAQHCSASAGTSMAQAASADDTAHLHAAASTAATLWRQQQPQQQQSSVLNNAPLLLQQARICRCSSIRFHHMQAPSTNRSCTTQPTGRPNVASSRPWGTSSAACQLLRDPHHPTIPINIVSNREIDRRLSLPLSLQSS